MSKETDLRAPLEKKPGDPRSAFAGRCSRMLRKKRGVWLREAKAHPARRQPPGTHSEGREELGRGSGVPGHLPSSGRGNAEPAGAASPWALPGARPRCPFPARGWAPQITELLWESTAEKMEGEELKGKCRAVSDTEKRGLEHCAVHPALSCSSAVGAALPCGAAHGQEGCLCLAISDPKSSSLLGRTF